MKNVSILSALLFALSLVVFPSCTSEKQSSNDAQKTAAPATTASVAGNQATMSPEEAKALNVKNMQEAFKGETTASAKYTAYSKKAEEEGYHQIALLFKAASTSENIHANNHKAVLMEGGESVPVIKPEFTVKTTAENLKDAIAGEGYEISTMYPEFLKNADVAGNQLSIISLKYAYKTEQKHKPLYEKALAALENKTANALPSVYYVCSTCGNTYDNVAPKRCNISMTSPDRFIQISNLSS